MSIPDPIANSNLPADVQSLIRQVIKRSRLWKRERTSLMLELLSHFQDGLEAGRSAEDLVRTFGDPKLAAKLMRRGKKRNRSAWWRIGRRMAQCVGIVILLYLGQMGYLLSGRPDPKTDYLTPLASFEKAVPDADRAWPIYREALLSDPIYKIDFLKHTPGKPRLVDSLPESPTWDRAAAALQQHQALVEAVRRGSQKPGLGLSPLDPDVVDEKLALPLFGPNGYVPQLQDAPPLATHSLMQMGRFPSGELYTMGQLTALDLRRAASVNDPVRVVEDYRSMLGLAGQMRQGIMSQICSLLTIDRADWSLAIVLDRHPDLFTSEQCVALLHMMADGSANLSVTANDSLIVTQDLLQRIYTDDGNGDGRLTREGVEYFRWLNSAGSSKPSSFWTAVSLPILSFCVASRREMMLMGEERHAAVDHDLRRSLSDTLNNRGENEKIMDRFMDQRRRIYYAPISTIIPQFGNCAKDIHIARAKHDALIVRLALEVHRRATGTYPRTLAELVPRYLSAVPLDPLASQPLLYTLRDGKPVIYARGQDGQDRGGALPEKPWSGSTVPKSSDWILFPQSPNR